MTATLCFIWDGPLTNWFHFPQSILLFILFSIFMFALIDVLDSIRRKRPEATEKKSTWLRARILLAAIAFASWVAYLAIKEIAVATAPDSFQPPLSWYDPMVLIEVAGAIIFPIVVVGLCTVSLHHSWRNHSKTKSRA
jgi:hypothetical protein